MRLPLALLLCLLALPAWLLAAPAGAFDFSGRWYGFGYQPAWGFASQWIAQRSSNGDLEIEFRRYENCQLVHRQVERGHWVVEGSRYSSLIAQINDKPVMRVEDYELLAQEGDIIRYRHLGSGQIFQARRVPADFTWPDCSGGQFTS